MKIPYALLLCVGLAAAGAAACSKNAAPPATAAADCCGDTKAANAAEAEGHPTLALLKEPMDVAPFTVKDLAGNTINFADLRGKVVLVNFWATWCPPCVKELPEINQFHDEFAAKGWQVLGLAVDAPTPVRGFLEKLPLKFPVALAGLTGTDLSRTLGNSKGGLPFTVAFGVQGEPIWRKLGATHLEELREMARSVTV